MFYYIQKKKSNYPVGPEGNEDEIHLNKNARKGQKTPHKRNYRWSKVPFLLRDRTRDILNTAWIVWCTTPVSSDNSTKEGQRQRDKSPNNKNNYNCANWNSSYGSIRYSNSV